MGLVYLRIDYFVLRIFLLFLKGREREGEIEYKIFVFILCIFGRIEFLDLYLKFVYKGC